MAGRRLKRFRQIAPTADRWVVCLAIFLLFEGPIIYFDWNRFPIAAHLPFRPGAFILVLAVVLHGVSRVVWFHPIWQNDYRAWLKRTPWTSRKPLPLGPIGLVWEDALVVGPLLLLCAILPAPSPVRLLCAFLISHLLVVTATLFMTATWAIGYSVAFGLGCALLLWPAPWVCLEAAALVYMLAYVGLRRGLDRFPWDTGKPEAEAQAPGVLTKHWRGEGCGWPFDRIMGDVRRDFAISRIDAVLCSMLVSWWLFVVTSLMPSAQLRFFVLQATLIIVSTFGPLLRVSIYTQGYASPITSWGRIRTLRWLIPGYDQAFVAPLCSLLAGPSIGGLFWAMGQPAEICLSLAVGATMLVALVAPPRLRHWRLTGGHRIEHDQNQARPPFVKVG